MNNTIKPSQDKTVEKKHKYINPWHCKQCNDSIQSKEKCTTETVFYPVKKVENGEVIEELLKDFIRETLTEGNNEPLIRKAIRNNYLNLLNTFISQALTEQRKEIVGEIGKVVLTGTPEEQFAQLKYYEKILAKLSQDRG